jgi:hypothetical protein
MKRQEANSYFQKTVRNNAPGKTLKTRRGSSMLKKLLLQKQMLMVKKLQQTELHLSSRVMPVKQQMVQEHQVQQPPQQPPQPQPPQPPPKRHHHQKWQQQQQQQQDTAVSPRYVKQCVINHLLLFLVVGWGHVAPTLDAISPLARHSS